ncbi:MAG: beta-ketoacyl-ACP synthase II [Catonella sp.]|uniref:beta-ketoacyl-ACP synthase II n=1 Tax=Catonella sp. TaxID=2382125 RepID=UPI003FA08425
MRRVVITGLGAVTPIGNDIKTMWQSVKSGKCGIAEITHFDTTDKKISMAGEVKDFNPEDFLDKKEVRRMDRVTQFALVAAKEAMADSGIELENVDRNRFGVVFSSGIGGIDTIEKETIKGHEKGNFEKISPFFIPMIIANMSAGQIAIAFGLHGMCTAPVTACASSTNAIGDAFRHIRDGYAELMLCGGSEATITELGIGGFASMNALSKSKEPDRASIPFDKERNGFVMGEGGGVLILEELSHALKRGAKIYAEVVGYGATCDASHITAPVEDGSIAAACFKSALADAKLSTSDVDYINAHGTSTPLNDKCETRAIRLAFGADADKLMVSSTKSMTGHMLGAAGVVEGIITVLGLKEGFVPATINYREKDEECDLDIVPNEGRNKEIKIAMSNSLGFGGHNATVVFKKYEEA